MATVERGRGWNVAVRGEPFSSCKLHVVPESERQFTAGDEGAFLITPAGSAYRIERVAGRTLHCTRWPVGEVPEDAAAYEWRWAHRGR